jgi:hypothetical protein
MCRHVSAVLLLHGTSGKLGRPAASPPQTRAGEATQLPPGVFLVEVGQVKSGHVEQEGRGRGMFDLDRYNGHAKFDGRINLGRHIAVVAQDDDHCS